MVNSSNSAKAAKGGGLDKNNLPWPLDFPPPMWFPYTLDSSFEDGVGELRQLMRVPGGWVMRQVSFDSKTRSEALCFIPNKEE